MIKFRAWHKELKKLCRVILLDLMPNALSLEVDCLYLSRPFEPYVSRWLLSSVELMQFTGLQDKNGKDIYEGDIMLDYDLNRYQVINTIFQDCTVYCRQPITTGTCLDAWGVALGEIIGNVYENPELLRQE